MRGGAKRLLTVVAALALLGLALPFGAGPAGAAFQLPPDVELPEGTPNNFFGALESVGVRPVTPLPGVGLSVDPGYPFTKGTLQANLVEGALPFQIKGIAATNDPGFIGGAVLFTDDAAVESTPGYAESYEEKPEADPTIDTHRYRHVEKCTSSPTAYSDACDPIEPEYMLTESTREGVPHQTNIARRGDSVSGGSFLSASDIRPGPGGLMSATVATFVSNAVLAPGVRVGSIRTISTSIWHVTDPSQRSTESICEASDIVPLDPTENAIPIPVGGQIRTIPGSNTTEETASGIGSSCTGPTLSITAPNGDQFVYLLGASSSQAGSSAFQGFAPTGGSTTTSTPPTTPPVTSGGTVATSPPVTASPTTRSSSGTPAATLPTTAPPTSPPPSGPPTATTSAPPPASVPGDATAAPSAPGGRSVSGRVEVPKRCLGMGFPACIGILTAFTGTLIAGGVYGLKFTMQTIAEPSS